MDTFDNYLANNSIDKREASKASEFYHKFDALEAVYDTIQISGKVQQVIGNVNSKICFVFTSEETYKSCKKILDKICGIYQTNLWNIALLFLCKTNDDSMNIAYLSKEIDIINPKVIYLFDCDFVEKSVKDYFQNSLNKTFTTHMIHVNNIESISSNTPSENFDLFKYLITYDY